MKPLYLVATLLLTISLCGCSSRRHLADEKMSATTHVSDTTESKTVLSAGSTQVISGSAVADVTEEWEAADSTVIETTIAWGLCPDGVVRPTAIRTASAHTSRGSEHSTADLAAQALCLDTASIAADTLSTATHDEGQHWEGDKKEEKRKVMPVGTVAFIASVVIFVLLVGIHILTDIYNR